MLLLAAWQSPVWGTPLHYFWAQEYTGADLLREKLEESTQQWKVSDYLFQIWDTNGSTHGGKCQ